MANGSDSVWGALWHRAVIHLHLSSQIISDDCLQEVREPALGGSLTEARRAACKSCRRSHVAVCV